MSWGRIKDTRFGSALKRVNSQVETKSVSRRCCLRFLHLRFLPDLNIRAFEKESKKIWRSAHTWRTTTTTRVNTDASACSRSDFASADDFDTIPGSTSLLVLVVCEIYELSACVSLSAGSPWKCILFFCCLLYKDIPGTLSLSVSLSVGRLGRVFVHSAEIADFKISAQSELCFTSVLSLTLLLTVMFMHYDVTCDVISLDTNEKWLVGNTL